MNKTFNYQTILLSIFSVFPILPYGILTAVNVMVLVAIMAMNFRDRNFNIQNIKTFFLCTGFYFFLVLSLTYSANLNEGLAIVQKTILLILFPFVIIFFGKRILEKDMKKILRVFVIVTLLLSSYSLFGTFKELNEVGYDKLFYWATLRRSMSNNQFLDLHPTYISLYAIISVYALVLKKVFNTYLNFAIGALMIFILVLMSARGVLLAIFLSGVVYLFLFTKFSVVKKFALSSAVVLFAYIAVSNVFLLNSRFNSLYQEIVEMNTSTIVKESSSNTKRAAILYTSREVLRDDWLFGIGVGDFEKQLHESYSKLGFEVLEEEKLNSHNYFLYLIGSSGIFALLLFLFLFYAITKLAIKKRDGLLFLCVLTFLFSLLFENLLTRAYGINLYCFCFSLFYLASRKSEGHRNVVLE